MAPAPMAGPSRQEATDGRPLPDWASAVVILVLTGTLIAIVGWLASRILGVRRGAGRSLIAGSIGVLGGVRLAEWERTAGANSTEEFLTFAGSALLVTLVISIVIDVILPRSVRGQRPIQAPKRCWTAWRVVSRAAPTMLQESPATQALGSLR